MQDVKEFVGCMCLTSQGKYIPIVLMKQTMLGNDERVKEVDGQCFCTTKPKDHNKNVDEVSTLKNLQNLSQST